MRLCHQPGNKRYNDIIQNQVPVNMLKSPAFRPFTQIKPLRMSAVIVQLLRMRVLVNQFLKATSNIGYKRIFQQVGFIIFFIKKWPHPLETLL